VIEMTGSGSSIIFEPLPQDDPTQRQPDITLAKAELGWDPNITLDQGLKPTIEYFRVLSA
jgi:UDP-glucuronate decarboxylase